MFACCDESGIDKGSRYWVIGAMWLPDDARLPAYEAAVVELRQETGCWGEIKWSKLGPAWLEAYRRFLALALELPDLKFTGLVIDTSLFTQAAMQQYHSEGRRDEAYLKFVRMLLRNHLDKFAAQGHCDFTVLYDQMSVRRDLLRNFHGVLGNDISNISARHGVRCGFAHLGPVNSAGRPLMQATDLVAGAIASVWNRSRDDSKKGEARVALRADIVEWAGCGLDATSNPRSGYDLWAWRPR